MEVSNWTLLLDDIYYAIEITRDLADAHLESEMCLLPSFKSLAFVILLYGGPAVGYALLPEGGRTVLSSPQSLLSDRK